MIDQMDKYIINTKLQCDPSKFLELKDYMSSQKSYSDPCILKMSYDIIKGHLDIEVKTTNINIFR